jgi:hypothetical protein
MINDILWAPAHVLWKESRNMIGWAPLPPGYSVREAVQFGSSVSVPREGWTFVPKEHMVSTSLAEHFLSDRNKQLIFRYAATLNQWQKKGEIIHYSGPDPDNFLFERNIRIPFFTFKEAEQQFRTRFLPDRSGHQPSKKNLFQYSEVRVDIGDRIAVVGPDSPRKLPRRKKRKIYYSSSSEPDRNEQRTTSIKRTTSTRSPTRIRRPASRDDRCSRCKNKKVITEDQRIERAEGPENKTAHPVPWKIKKQNRKRGNAQDNLPRKKDVLSCCKQIIHERIQFHRAVLHLDQRKDAISKRKQQNGGYPDRRFPDTNKAPVFMMRNGRFPLSSSLGFP